MNPLKKILVALTSQVKQTSVTLPVKDIPHKITDDNQSIHNGVIHEKFTSHMRGQTKPRGAKRRKR